METIAYIKAKKALRFVQSAKMTNKHRILVVDPNALFLNGYDMVTPIDAFAGGYLTETCSYEAFVNNATDWKTQFDVIVINTQNEIQCDSGIIGDQVKAAINTFMSNGVKLLLFTGDSAFSIRKWDANGTYVSTSLTTLLGGIGSGTSVNFSAKTGSFQHSADYQFSDEILRTECIPSTEASLNLVATDPLVTFPIKAVQDASEAKMVAYKPNTFFVVATGGTTGDSVDKIPYWKYVKSDIILNILLGKDNAVHLAIDSCNGRKVAAFGVDCDTTTDIGAINALHSAFTDNVPIEWGVVTSKITDVLAGYFRGLSGNNRLVSHTQTHYATASRITVTDEIHIVPSSQLVKVYRPFKVLLTSIKTTDDVTTFTQKTGTITRTATDAGTYVINQITTDITSNNESMDGLIKFHASDIGKEIKVTYTCINEPNELIGSLSDLKAKGCITDQVVYTTYGINSVSPSTFLRAESEGVIIAEYLNFPGYGRVWASLNKTQKKSPFLLGPTMMHEWRYPTVDTQWFTQTKQNVKDLIINPAIARCNAMELPFTFYVHDFIISSTDTGGVWLDSTARWNADWKKATIVETQTYIADIYNWVITQLIAQNPFWMTRSEYIKRYEYLNKYLSYDVNSSNGYSILVENKGNKIVEGITFKIPMATEPTSIILSNGSNANYTYANGITTVWFDLPSGISVVIDIR